MTNLAEQLFVHVWSRETLFGELICNVLVTDGFEQISAREIVRSVGRGKRLELANGKTVAQLPSELRISMGKICASKKVIKTVQRVWCINAGII